jgi:hypothetical protein
MTKGHRLKDIAGQRYGRLVALERVGTHPTRNRALWRCACDCGAFALVCGVDLRVGKTLSCGCVQRLTAAARLQKHGLTDTAEFRVWRSMLTRCYNTRSKHYVNYGARGIQVCDSWRWSFVQFLADMGNRPSCDLSIDRINNDGNYEPGNCRWATRIQQRRNRRDYIAKHGGAHAITGV